MEKRAYRGMSGPYTDINRISNNQLIWKTTAIFIKFSLKEIKSDQLSAIYFYQDAPLSIQPYIMINLPSRATMLFLRALTLTWVLETSINSSKKSTFSSNTTSADHSKIPSRANDMTASQPNVIQEVMLNTIMTWK